MLLSSNLITGALCRLAILITVLRQGAIGLRVEFFKNENYADFLKSIEPHDDTENDCIPVNLETDVRSVKTDKCIMVFYYNTVCMSTFSYMSIPHNSVGDAIINSEIIGKLGKIGGILYDGSTRLDKDEPKFERQPHPMMFHPKFNYKDFQPILSLSKCSRKFGGGPEVDVDFYPKPYYDGPVAAQYKDVCGCRNVDKMAVGGKSHSISVDNHGNGIDVFEEENCAGQTKTLKPGNSLDSKAFMYGDDETKKFDVRSFRSSAYKNCVK